MKTFLAVFFKTYNVIVSHCYVSTFNCFILCLTSKTFRSLLFLQDNEPNKNKLKKNKLIKQLQPIVLNNPNYQTFERSIYTRLQQTSI